MSLPDRSNLEGGGPNSSDNELGMQGSTPVETSASAQKSEPILTNDSVSHQGSDLGASISPTANSGLSPQADSPQQSVPPQNKQDQPVRMHGSLVDPGHSEVPVSVKKSSLTDQSSISEQSTQEPFNPYASILCPKSGEPMITVTLWGAEIEYSESGWWFDGGVTPQNASDPSFELFNLLSEHAETLEILQNVRGHRPDIDLNSPLAEAREINRKRISRRRELDDVLHRISESEDLFEHKDKKNNLVSQLTQITVEIEKLEKHSLPIIKLDPVVELRESGNRLACPHSLEPMVPIFVFGQEIFASRAGVWAEYEELLSILDTNPKIDNTRAEEQHEQSWFDVLFQQSRPNVSAVNRQIDVPGEIKKALSQFEKIEELEEKLVDLSCEIFMAKSNKLRRDKLFRQQWGLQKELEEEKAKLSSGRRGIDLTSGWRGRVRKNEMGSGIQTPADSASRPADAPWPKNMEQIEGMLLCPASGMPMYKVDADGKGLILDISADGIWLDGLPDESSDICSGELGMLLQYQKDAQGFWQGSVMGGQNRISRIVEKIEMVQRRQESLKKWWEDTRVLERSLPNYLLGSSQRIEIHKRLGELSGLIINEYKSIEAASELD